jgi:hypothetical protein
MTRKRNHFQEIPYWADTSRAVLYRLPGRPRGPTSYGKDRLVVGHLHE